MIPETQYPGMVRASHSASQDHVAKIDLIVMICCPLWTISAIKLKRTDTTLDLSHTAKKAGEKREEEGCENVAKGGFYRRLKGEFGRYSGVLIGPKLVDLQALVKIAVFAHIE